MWQQRCHDDAALSRDTYLFFEVAACRAHNLVTTGSRSLRIAISRARAREIRYDGYLRIRIRDATRREDDDELNAFTVYTTDAYRYHYKDAYGPRVERGDRASE